MTESDPPKQVNHVLQKPNPRETCHYQSTSQWRGRERNECQVIRWFFQKIDSTVEKFEVLQVLKQSNEIHNLPTGLFGCSQSKGLDCGHEMAKIPSNPGMNLGMSKESIPRSWTPVNAK